MKSTQTTSADCRQSLEALRQIDKACTGFEKALRRGEVLNIAELVANAAPDERQTQ